MRPFCRSLQVCEGWEWGLDAESGLGWHSWSFLLLLGHRMCPGDQLARMELFLMFATLLRTFRFQLPVGSPGLRLEYIFGGTLQPQPQQICAVPRLSRPRAGPRKVSL